MSNDYYERQASLPEFTTARSDDVRNEFDGVASGFEKLPTPRQDGTKGFLTPFTIVTPTASNQPAQKGDVDNAHTKNGEQDVRLDAIELTLVGMGDVEQRYTTLRYVAVEGQTEIVLPVQFESLAYVHKNGIRLFQTVDFDYESSTKTITFYQALTADDIILVDVGLVPDALLIDLVAIQNDITSKHSDVDNWHSDVDAWQQQVSNDKDATVSAALAAQAGVKYEGIFVSNVTNAIAGYAYSFSSSIWQCISNTTDDPQINHASWNKVVSISDINAAEARGLGAGVSLYKGSNGLYVSDGDTITAGTTHLTIFANGQTETVKLDRDITVSGVVSNLTSLGCDIGIYTDVVFKYVWTADYIATNDGRSVQKYLDDLSVKSDLIIFIPFGQSNSVRRAPRVSEFATPANLFTFNGGAEKGDDTIGSTINIIYPVLETDMESLVACNENGEDAEGLAPGFASGVIGRITKTVYTWTGGIGARHWRDLKPGTQVWSAFVQAMAQFYKIATDNGYTDIKWVFYWDHGESEADDSSPGGGAETPVTKEGYIEVLTNVNAAISKYIGYVTGNTTQEFTVLMTPIQFSGLTTEPTHTFREVQNAQLEFSRITTNWYMIGGKSQMTCETDNVHTTGLGRRYLAEKAAQVLSSILLNGTWEPLYMQSATRTDNVVYVKCKVPEGILVIDTGTIPDTAEYISGSKYGFEYYDDTGKIGITDIAVSGDEITITLDSTPSGTDEILRCAQIQPVTATTNSNFKPRTNIRASGNVLKSKLDGSAIYDFMVPHSIEVN